jgi:hypothetical protein
MDLDMLALENKRKFYRKIYEVGGFVSLETGMPCATLK